VGGRSQLTRDWREFRASLVAQSEVETALQGEDAEEGEVETRIGVEKRARVQVRSRRVCGWEREALLSGVRLSGLLLAGTDGTCLCARGTTGGVRGEPRAAQVADAQAGRFHAVGALAPWAGEGLPAHRQRVALHGYADVLQRGCHLHGEFYSIKSPRFVASGANKAK
jgi:hypothetical protein